MVFLSQIVELIVLVGIPGYVIPRTQEVWYYLLRWKSRTQAVWYGIPG